MSLSAIGIASKDIDKTLQFYKLLDLEFKHFGEGHYEAVTDSGIRIMLDIYELLKRINKNWKEPHNSGITLCFERNSPLEVDKTFNILINSGHQVEKEPWDAFWGQRYSCVKDPDGNQIDLFAAL